MRERFRRSKNRRFFRYFVLCGLFVALSVLLSCSTPQDPNTLVMIIESSPTNLDPRVGVDAQAERIDALIFDDLLGRDEKLNVKPALAETWDVPNPLTYIFHLRHGVKFHDGRPLTSRDVKWTFDSLLHGKLRSTKAAVYRPIDHIDAPDDYTVIFHLSKPFAGLLWNVSDGAMGIVPYGSGEDLSSHPVGSGPFRFVSAAMDQDVVLARNNDYWGGPPNIARVRFAVIPDTTTRALELRKGSADIESNAIPADMVESLRKEPRLQVLQGPGTIFQYMAFNLRDPILKDVRVRQAIAYAVDRKPIIQYIWRDYARPAGSILPPESWAYDADVRQYNYDPARSRKLLDEAGYPAVNGVRFHLQMKSSTEETTRLVTAVLQQQMRGVGIALDIRTFESATFLSDVMRGAFQLYSLRWIGGNEDPDIFHYVFDSSQFPPNGANRGYYHNPEVDTLIAQGNAETGQNKRKRIYARIQQILAEQLPYINLWYFDNVVVASRRVEGLQLDPSGSYDFLRTVKLADKQ